MNAYIFYADAEILFNMLKTLILCYQPWKQLVVLGVYLKAGRVEAFFDLGIPPKPYQIGNSRNLADILTLIYFPA